MVWARVDDDFHRHEKVAALLDRELEDEVGALALGAWVLALSFCWDRPVPSPDFTFAQLRRLLPLRRDRLVEIADALVQVGLWEAQDSERYLIHDFADYSVEASQERKREKARARKQKQRDNNRSDRDQEGGVTHTERDLSVTERDCHAVSRVTERDLSVTRARVRPRARDPDPEPDPEKAAEAAGEPGTPDGRAHVEAPATWLEHDRPIAHGHFGDIAAAANAVVAKHQGLRQELGAKPLKFGIQGDRYDAVQRAVQVYSPAELAVALEVAAFVAKRKNQPQILDARIWVGYRGGSAEIVSWLETSLAEEAQKLAQARARDVKRDDKRNQPDDYTPKYKTLGGTPDARES